MGEEIELSRTNDVSHSLPLIIRRIKSMPRKTKLTFCLKSVIVLLCVCGLLAFSTVLFKEFTSGKTVVNIKYEILDYNKIPGITICFFHGLSLEKMRDKNPKLLSKLENDLNSDPLNYTNNKVENETNMATKYVNYVYSPFFNFNHTVQQLFDLSIPMSSGFRAEGMCRTFNETYFECNHYDIRPIESIAFEGSYSIRKCFTFFSHLNDTWRNISMHVNKLYLTIDYSENWYPSYYHKFFTEAVRLSMHTPDELPQYNTNNFIKLNIGQINTIRFNRIKMILLGSKYDTNCKNYSIDDTQAENQMRSNCVKYCVKKEMDLKNRKFHLDTFYYTDNLWINKEIKVSNNYKICDAYRGKDINCYPDQKLLKTCENECQMKCINRYYTYDNYEDKYYGNYYSINIVHNQLPDQVTEHMPETTPIEFISNFGGLLGMWLGLSALAILKFTMQLIHRVKRLDSVKDV